MNTNNYDSRPGSPILPSASKRTRLDSEVERLNRHGRNDDDLYRTRGNPRVDELEQRPAGNQLFLGESRAGELERQPSTSRAFSGEPRADELEQRPGRNQLFLGESRAGELERQPSTSRAFFGEPRADELERRPRFSRKRTNDMMSGELERRSRNRDLDMRPIHNSDYTEDELRGPLRNYTSSRNTPERATSSRSRNERRSRSRSHNERRSRSRSRDERRSRSKSHHGYRAQGTTRYENSKPNNMFFQFIDALKGFSKSGSHKLANMSSVIPEFDPMSKNQSILNWINKVEECADIYEWEEREIIYYALPKLTGLAKSWYQSLPSVKFTWSEWKTTLFQSFPCRENYAELLTEMLTLMVKYGELLEPYYYSKLNLLHRCQITGKRAVDCILYGIEDRAIKVGAQAAQYDTPEQVLRYLKSVKVGQTRENNGNNLKSRNDNKKTFGLQSEKTNQSDNKLSSTVTKPPIRCFNCRVEGHPSFKCPKPIEKCNNCHRLGHVTANCPNMPQKNRENPKPEEVGQEKQV